ncbi:MAG TPA: DUF1801 domain-containing protein [Patescibacteria group bacterium]|nr:DUF1801 domain-containing protein [Patescibacteria group bacterium]
MKIKNYKDIDKYIDNFSGDTRKKLEDIRKTIKSVVPKEATEKISYGIPTYYLNGNLLHFAGYKAHIGFYPGSASITEFKKELAAYKTSRGTVQFPHDKPLPLDLIRKIAGICVERNQTKKKN